jgi:energy-coupling factor transporter ATP-binding protein EcfA2
MKLLSLRMEPAGATGWSSETLVFGNHITQLFGPNGSGKTPIIQSMAHVLGHPVKFREDVLKNCSAAVLRIQSQDRELELRRKLGTPFEAQIRADGTETQTFYVERDYSNALLALFQLKLPTLTSTNNEPVTPYMATILPLFFLDQDHGYTSAYHPAAVFIKNQYAEMMRLVFGLPPKHSFERKKFVIEKKRRLDQIDHLIVKKVAFIEDLTKELGKARRPPGEIDDEIEIIKGNLERLKQSRSVKSEAHSALDELIYDKQAIHKTLRTQIAELQVRVGGFQRIKTEIEVEINTLSLNEEARRVFTSFQEICSNTACGLFLGSSDSYGKNLLYLRDQVKDLQRNAANQQARLKDLAEAANQVAVDIKALSAKRDALVDGDEVSGLVESIGQYTRRIFELQRERQSVEELETDERAYIELLNERETIQNDLASLGGSAGESDLRSITIRAKWRERILYWLDILKTMNVSTDMSIDADFEIQFGQEKITQFKGSTLLRVVLAIRTAAFELYLGEAHGAFRFLILDTPRQQDVQREDLGGYIEELKRLAAKMDAQIVFSTTNYRYKCLEGDAEWQPTFAGAKQKMFLGTIGPTAVD